MNITDSIVDKILYKEFTTKGVGQRVYLELPFFDNGDNTIDDEECYLIYPEDGEKTLCEFLPKISGELEISIRVYLSPSPVDIKVYVGDEIVLSANSVLENTVVETLKIIAFSKIKVTGKTTGESSKIVYVRLEGYIREKENMYIIAESEK